MRLTFNLIIFAVIAFGGTGIVMHVVDRDSSLGLILIGISLALAVPLVELSKRLYRINIVPRNPRIREPISLGTYPANRIVYWPGRPEGYAGYTDWNMMKCTINNDLMLRPSDEQFSLIGFGLGFASAMIKRESSQGVTAIFHCTDTSELDERWLGWLAAMQRDGTDNAGQSTENLNNILNIISREMFTSGPVRQEYWDKVRNEIDESLEYSGTSSDELNELQAIHDRARARGCHLSSNARVERK